MLKNKKILISFICLIFTLSCIYLVVDNKKTKQENIVNKHERDVITKPIGTTTTKVHHLIKEGESNDVDKIDEKTEKNKLTETPKTTPTEKVINNKSIKKNITAEEYLHKLKSIKYTIKQQDTLSKISRKYEETCNPNTCINVIKRLNNLKDVDNIEPGHVISIPEDALKNGKLYKVQKGDTWYKIALNNFKGYDVDAIKKLIIAINNLPNEDLPLGEKIFLPKL